MYLHQDGVSHVLIVVNLKHGDETGGRERRQINYLKKSSPRDEGRSSAAHQTFPGANIENLK